MVNRSLNPSRCTLDFSVSDGRGMFRIDRFHPYFQRWAIFFFLGLARGLDASFTATYWRGRTFYLLEIRIRVFGFPRRLRCHVRGDTGTSSSVKHCTCDPFSNSWPFDRVSRLTCSGGSRAFCSVYFSSVSPAAKVSSFLHAVSFPPGTGVFIGGARNSSFRYIARGVAPRSASD